VRRLLVSTFSAVAALALVTTAAPASAAPLSPSDTRVRDMLTSRVVNPYLGPYVSGYVIDADSGQPIWGKLPDNQRLPASVLKLATAVTALQVYTPAGRLTTTARRGSTWQQVVLVGAGDPSLSSSALSVLAAATATRVRSHGVRSVHVYVDDTLFPAPTNAPGWLSGYVPGQVRPVRALVVDERHATDTSLDAGKVFAAKLIARGVAVASVQHGRGRGGLLIGSVQGQTMQQIVTRMMLRSDNDHAEALFRLVAVGRRVYPTWAASAKVRFDLLAAMGVGLGTAHMYDGSGLSRYDRMSVRQLVSILALARSPKWPRLASLAHGALPLAGLTGSLVTSLGRYDTAPTSCAKGKLYGKTGLLHDVVSLAGYATGADGRTKVYAFVVNGLPDAGLANKRAVDRLSSTITGCW
jgi:D-alanyl-D-alanine carboxypeptidase/D-alanyl-D-alanine-endopeptidase (penicillin-binding protein 4)